MKQKYNIKSHIIRKHLIDLNKKIHNIYIKVKFHFFAQTKAILMHHKKKAIIIGGIFFLITISNIFSKKENLETSILDFYVNTTPIEEFNNWIQINKPWKIVWAQEIVVSAQAMWSIKSIEIQEWQEVWQDYKLVELNDDLANYGIMVQRAKNALNSANLQYSQNKTQLEQWIANSQLAVERSQTSLTTATSLWKQNIRWAENNLNNADNQKNSLILQLDSEKNTLTNLLNDILHKSDDILWATTQYKTNNDSYEIYLSAKNTSYKLTGKSQLLALYKQKESLSQLSTSSEISTLQLKNNIETINTIYKDIIILLDTMENIFIKSVSSTTFTQTTIDWLIAANNMSQSSTQASFTYFTAFKQQADGAIIDNWDWYIIAWSESADIWYQSTITSTEQQISDATLWLKTAELNYQTAMKNQNNTLWLASTSITNAKLAYQETLKQYNKLKIKAPITWTISKILVDKWQEIRIWTPLLTITNNSDPLVEVWITATEYKKIDNNSKILIEYMWDTLSGEIISIASQAGQNWLYNLTIKLNKQIDILWDTAKILISSDSDKTTLPLNIVHPMDNDKGYIYILKDGEPDILNITLWKIRWSNIEILSKIPLDTQIITNDIANYNTTIHKLIIK